MCTELPNSLSLDLLKFSLLSSRPYNYDISSVVGREKVTLPEQREHDAFSKVLSLLAGASGILSLLAVLAAHIALVIIFVLMVDAHIVFISGKVSLLADLRDLFLLYASLFKCRFEIVLALLTT